MARGVNKVILVGNLGNDPEIRYTQNQKQVANLSIATSDSWTDRQTGQRQERTEWHRVVLFERLAEIAGQYLKKGSKVYIEGRLQTRKWQNQQGVDQYTTEIVGNDLQMLDSRGAEGGQNYSNAGGSYAQQGYQQQGYAAPQQQAPQQPAPQPYAQPAPAYASPAAPAPQQAAPPQQPQQQYNQAPPAAPQQPQQPQKFDDFDDSIPF